MYKIVQNYFIKTETNFYSITTAEIRVLKNLIIKELPTNIEENDLRMDLIGKGYEVKTLRQFCNENKRYSIHMVFRRQ